VTALGRPLLLRAGNFRAGWLSSSRNGG